MRKFLLVFFCLSCLRLQAQQYSFINYSVENGLASSQVIDICQDELGYLWVGTQSGLSRFDGISFKNYSVNEGLTDNKVEKLYLSESGVIWVATQKGVSAFQRASDQFESYYFNPDEKELDTRVNSLLEYQSSMYIASDSGIYILQDQQIEKLDDRAGLKPRIRQFCNLGDTALYCGTNQGILIWKDDTYSRFQHPELDSINISGINYYPDVLSVATVRDGIITYDFQNGRTEVHNDLASRYRSIYADSSIILGVTRGNGVVEITDEGSFFYNGESGMLTESVRSAFVDAEGNIWIGTDGNGLLKFSGKSVLSYQMADGLNSELVLSITQGPDCTYVFGTYDAGLAIHRPDGGFSYIGFAEGVRHTTVWAVEPDQDKGYYLATQNGVDFLEISERDTVVYPTEVDAKSRALHFLKDRFLAGGVDGIYGVSRDSASQLESTSTMDINKVVSTQNHLYVGANSGLYEFRLDQSPWTYRQLVVPENNVQTLCADRNGNLWIGTINGLFLKTHTDGVVRIDLDQKEFFRSRNIVGVLEDHAGNIWVSTYNGVYLLSRTDPDSYAYETKHYTLSEGLVNLECNQNALYEDHLNHIWVGTAAGLARIDPSLNEILFDYEIPNLHFTGIRLFTENFDYSEYKSIQDSMTGIPTEITLPYNKNHITFDFIGVNMKDPDAVNYTYRLAESESDEWSPISSTNYATYSAVQPGEYTFEVKAANKNMEWSEVQRIRIVILPPFWRTWWFLLLIAFAVAGLITLIFRARIRVIKQKQENERLGFKNRLLFLEQRSLNASMNRHFIFNSLNSIQYFINSSDKRSANKYLSSFAKLIRKNLDSSTTNNFIVTLQEEVERIELYLALEKMRFHEKFDYELDVSSDLEVDEIEIPSMILQPFVENSIIHGVLPKEVGGKIQVKIYREYDEVVFEVIDNGVGIDNSLIKKDVNVAGDHESKGMEITNRRIELLRKLTGENLLIIGPFQLNTEDGTSRGTKVIIKMGLSQELMDGD